MNTSLLVVGAAIVRSGRLLVAQRAAPPALAGLWEFPGGKVERGESPEAALRRECAEELGVEIEVGASVGDDVPVLDGSALLRVFACSLVAGEPEAREHRQLRWVDAASVDTVAWLPTNRPVLPAVAALLRHTAGEGQ